MATISTEQAGFLDRIVDVAGITDAELVARSSLTVTKAQIDSKPKTFNGLQTLSNPQATKYQNGATYQYGILNVDRTMPEGKMYSQMITGLVSGNYGSAQEALAAVNNTGVSLLQQEIVVVNG